MRTMFTIPTLLAAAWLSVPAEAQPSARRTSARDSTQRVAFGRDTLFIRRTDSTYRIIAGPDTLRAITKSMQQAHMKALVDLNAARAEIALQKATIDTFSVVVQAGDTARERASALIKEQGDQIADLKKLVDLLETKLRRANPLISVEAGAGLNKNGLGAIGAIGIRRVRVWGTLQEQGSGLFAGLFIPVF